LSRENRVPLHYFDICGGAVALIVGARVASLASTPGFAWNAITSSVATALIAAVIVSVTLRARAYRQPTPWLASMFGVTTALAMVVFFWPLHVLLFAVATAWGCLVLAFGLLMRTRPLSDPISRLDVFKLAAVAGGMLGAVLAFEAALRFMPGVLSEQLRMTVVADRRQYGIAHPYVGHLHRPNETSVVAGKDFRAVHEVDAKGFRNTWPWPVRAEIVAIGDSVTFGYGAKREEAWPTIVSEGLDGVPLINLSLIGAGPQQYLRVYETFGLDLRPKLLLVGLFVGNDFWDAEVFDLWLKSGAGGNYMVWRDFGRPAPLNLRVSDPTGSLRRVYNRYVYPVLRSSRTYNLLRAFHGGIEGDLAVPPRFVRFDDGSTVRLLAGDFRRKSESAAADSAAFQLTLQALQAIHATAAKHGTHVLMVLQPSKEEVYLPLVESNVPDPALALREAFAAHGIDFLDLAPGFRQRASEGVRLFFEEDGHPNPSGYALTADLVLSHLRKHAGKYGLDETRVARSHGPGERAMRLAAGPHNQ
jgi:lysophospholipase L1-like esterase